ncbi:MAG: pyridine nucleotide-disulfide oxidoreductase, partial [Planctomycetes bacterium]|nr:pyridine nucleotide-disulfide oxidoreductase [Planctomycetota bacterium]
MPDTSSAWRCMVCGYIHRGPAPPEVCPVCGVSREEFEPYREVASPTGQAAAEQWRCMVCEHVHDGSGPPDACPVCGAVAESFEPVIELAALSGATADAGETWRAVVVGAGIAGIAAVESLRAAGSSVEITLVS